MAFSPLLGPSLAQAGHAMLEGSCYDCHDLKAGYGEPNTGYLGKTKRNMGVIKAAWAAAGKPNYGGTAKDTPDEFGCLYCHNSSALKDDPGVAGITPVNKMRDASNHFRGKASAHPVGYNLTNTADTNGHLLSTFDCYNGGYGVTKIDPKCENVAGFDNFGDRTTELDCVDCHDVTQVVGGTFWGYPEHGTPLATNPFMLRVSGAGFNLAAGEYDGACRRCHGSATGVVPGIAAFKSTGKDLRLGPTKHQDGSDITTNVMKEKDNTLLKVVDANADGVAEVNRKQCSTCHDPHYSATNKRLFAPTIEVSNGSKCTDCHFGGDRYGNFTAHGHGMPLSSKGNALDMSCSNCHDVSTSHSANRPLNGTKMLNTKPDPDTSGKTGKSLRSICTNFCHAPASYPLHGSGSETMGCIDCHDEHAEGSGPGSNTYMIPRSLPNNHTNTSLTFFQSTGAGYPEADYWVDNALPRKAADGMGSVTNAGLCDNGACHTGVKKNGTGANVFPLVTFVGGGTHSGGSTGGAVLGGNCDICHKHTDAAGAWRATASCDDCHKSTDPAINTTEIARTHLSPNENLATHNLHVASGFFTGGCGACHIHDGTNVGAGTGTHMDGVVNFGGPRMLDTTLNYVATGFGGATCTTNTCHDAEAGEWKNGLNFVNNDACADCHASVGKLLSQGGFPPTTNKHPKHVSPYVPGDGVTTYHCTDCHGAGGDAGLHPGHLNGSVTIATSGTNVDITNFSAADKTCVNSCHVVGMGVVAKRWTTGVLVCVDCHSGTNFAAAVSTSGLHAGVPTITGRTHDESFVYNSGASTASCDTCHTATPTTPTTNHLNGVIDASSPIINFAANVGFVDGATPTCAPSLAGCHTDQLAGTAWARKWAASATATDGTECANCHGGSPTDAAPGVWTTWTTNAGTLVRPVIPAGPGALTGPHATDWDGLSGEQIQLTHSACKTCHGMNSPTDAEPTYNVTSMWGAPGFHGNNSIDMNGPSAQANLANNSIPIGAEFNGNDDASLETSDFSCTKACHQGAQNVNRNMGDSGWTVKYGDYGSGNCDGCHGYPPLTAADMAARLGGEYVNAAVDTQYGGYAGGGAAHNAADHIATSVVATNGWTPCLPCHPSATHATTTSVLRANLNVAFPATYNAKSGAAGYVPGAAVDASAANCTKVSCHGGQTTPPWNGGTLNVATCTLCHTAAAAASQATAAEWNTAWSGLHNRVGSVSLEDHTAVDASIGDITDSSTCNQCHLLPALHFSGMDTQATDALTDADFVTTYDGTGGNISNTTGCAVTCHNDTNAGTPRWARKWSITVTATTGAECANCHGTQLDGWVSGVSHRTDAGPYNTHGQTTTYPQRGCNECHAIGDASYDFVPKWDNTAGGQAGNHGNEIIELNSNGSNVARLAGGDLGETGCTACHLAGDGFLATQHGFPSVTRWSFATLNNGQYSGCTGCHGSSTGNFWPDNTAATTLAIYPDRDGGHIKHVTAIIDRLNVDNTWNTGVAATDRLLTPFTLTKTDQEQICGFCHNDVAGFGGTGHYDATYNGTTLQRDTAEPADVNSINRMWSPYAADAGSAFAFTPLNNTYDGAGNLTTGRGCAAVDCHAEKTTPATYEWYGAGTSSCIMCHQDIASAVVATGISHNAHVNAATNFGGTAITCASCHTTTVPTSWSGNIAPTANHINGTLAINGSVTFTYAASSCGTNVCHTRGYSDGVPSLVAPYNVNGAGTYAWGTAYADCTLCHGDKLTAVAFNAPATAHATHLNSSLNFGRDITCNDCHTAANVGTHLNGSVTFSGAVTYSLAGNAITGAATWGTCNAGSCHNNGQGAPLTAAVNPVWNAGVLTDCTLCHLATGLVTNSHNEHLRFPSAPCGDCHAAATVATHMNGSINFNAAAVTYSRGAAVLNDAATSDNGTCTTVSCHNRGTTVSGLTASAVWNTTVDLACDACHYYSAAATAATNAGWSAVSATSHGKHFDKGKLCADCHGALPGDTVHINGSTTTTNAAIASFTQNVVGEAGVSMPAYTTYNTGTHTCSAPTSNGLGCHATGIPDWDLADNGVLPLVCTACHTDTTTAAVNPASGVHGNSRISANAHDGAWDADGPRGALTADCVTCHNMALTTLHENGGLTAASAQSTLAGATIGFTAGAPASCSPNGALAACHSDGGAWKRVWDSTASLNTGAECMNCHGGVTALYGAGNWVAGISQRHSDAQVSGNHAVCDYCHEYNNGSTAPYNLGTMHNDGSIQLNATVVTDLGYVENGTAPNKRIGCTNCHSGTDDAGGTYANGLHEFDMLTDGTRWARANLDGATYDCNSCHTLNTVNHTSPGENLTLHNLHTNSPLTACSDCHANPGAGGHNAANTVQLDGSKITLESYVQGAFDGNCANTCHTPASSTWVLPNTVACVDCHAAGRIGGALLGAHTAHGVTVGVDGSLCVNCHGAGAYTKTLTGLHGNSATNFSGVTYTGARNVLTGTCTTTACHNSLADPSTAWNTTALACDDCHYYVAGDPTSAGNVGANWALGGSHNAHFDATAVKLCNDCHTDNAADATQPLTHINTGVYTTSAGLIDRSRATGLEASLTAGGMGGMSRAVTVNTQTCNSVLCHNPSSDAHVSFAWNTANAGCAMCHVDPAVLLSTPPTGSHAQHRSGTVQTNFGMTIACTDCHVDYSGNPMHMNGSHDIRVVRDGVATVVTTQLAVGPGTIAVPSGCGINDCHNNGLARAATAGLPNSYTWGSNAIVDKCTVCHNNAATMVSNGHAKHLNNGYASAPCTDCHTVAGGAMHMNRSINFQNLAATAGTLGVTNNVAVGTGAGTTPINGTCATLNCHNRGTTVSAATMSAVWNVGGNGLACDACHYYSAAATAATNTGWSAVSATSHGKHFDKGKLCANCHGLLPTNAAHIGGKTTLTSGAIATYTQNVVGETGVSMAAYTTYNTGTHTCSAPTGNGLGCHATGTPDWDLADNGVLPLACAACHTDKTTAAVNPTSGLHGVVPSVTGEQHDESFGTGGTLGCANCHNVTALGTHANAAFTGDGSLPGDRTNMGLQNFTYTSTVNNAGTCATTAAGCHDTTRNDWAHKWMATPANYTSATLSCTGCHGDFTGWNTGVIHKNTAKTIATHGTGTTYQCKDCHVLEAGTNNYTFTFGTTDWFPLNGTSEHGNGTIEVNSAGATYSGVSGVDGGVGYCAPCHSAVPFDIADTSWPLNKTIVGNTISAGCGGCHGYPPLDNIATHPNAAQYVDAKNEDYVGGGGAHGVRGHVPFGVVEAGGWANCDKCHNNGGSHLMATPLSANVGNVTVVVDNAYDVVVGAPLPSYAGVPLTYATMKTCDNISCHFGLTPDWAMRATVTPGTLTVATPDALPAAGNSYRDSTNVATDKLTWTTNAVGPVTVSGFTVTLSGTATNASVTNVKIWQDAGTIGTWDVADTLIGTGVWGGANYTVTGLSYTIPLSTVRTILVTVDIPATATLAATIITNVTAVTANGTVVGPPIAASTARTIGQGTLTATTPDALPGATSVGPSTTNYLVDKLTWTVTNGPATVTGFTFTENGTGSSTDISNVKVWEDLGTAGAWDVADVLVGTATWGGVNYAVTGLNYTVPVGARAMLVTVDTSAGAVNGLTIQVTNTAMTASNGTIAGMPVTASAIFTIAAPGTLTVATPDALPAAGTVYRGATNVVTDKLTWTTNAVGPVTVSGFTVAEGGSAAPTTDITNVKIWQDAGTIGTWDVADTLIGTGTWSGSNCIATGLSYTIPVSTARTIIVTVDIPATATLTNTIVTTVSAVTASSGTIVGTPVGASTVQTIGQGTLTATTPDALPAAGNVSAGTTNFLVDKLTWTVTNGPATVTGFTFTTTGTATNTDITNGKVWEDLGTLGAWDVADVLVGTATWVSGTTYSATGLNYTLPVGARALLVTVDMAAGAITARTLTLQNTAITASNGTIAGLPVTASLVFTVGATTQLTVSTPDALPALKNIAKLRTNEVVDKLTWATNAGGAMTVTGFTITESGTAVAADMTNCKIHRDVNASGTWDAGDTLVGTGTWVGSACTATGLTFAIPVSTSYNMIVTVDIPAAATTNNVIAVSTTAVTVAAGSVTGLPVAVTPNFTIVVGTYAASTRNATHGAATALGGGQSTTIADLITTYTPAAANWGLLNTTADTTQERVAYTTPVGTTPVLMATFINNTALNGNVLTSATYSFHGRYTTAGQQWRAILVDYNPVDSSVSEIAASGITTTFTGTAGTDLVFTSVAVNNINYSLPDGHKFGLRFYGIHANGTEITEIRLYTFRTGSSSVALTGANAGAAAPVNAPPSDTGGSTAMACDTCHQFGPLDDTLDANNHPTTGTVASRTQYIYPSAGDHIKHSAGDPQTWAVGKPNLGTDESLLPAMGRCTNCHGNTTAYTNSHANGTVQFPANGIGGSFSAKTGNWVSGSKTCTNVNCHGNIATAVWGTGTTTCTSCHTAQSSGVHLTHLNRASYVIGCQDCHGANSQTGTHAGHIDGTKNTAGVGYAAGTGLCSTNVCHANGIWTGPVALACLDCHFSHATYDYIGDKLGANLPVSGLHAMTNLVDHDGTLTGGTGAACVKCHTATPTTTAANHINGVFQTGAATPYNWNLTNIPTVGYVRATDACAATCHTDNATWNREWSGVVDAVEVLGSNADDNVGNGVCGNCHGTFASGWNIIGATDHVNPDVDNDAGATPQLANSKTNHSVCTKCHGWGTGAYTATMHNNGTLLRLQMNSDLGYGDATGACATVCHGAFTLTMNPTSGWTVAMGAFGGLTCGSCHADGALPPTSGAHTMHFNSIGTGAGSNTDYTECEACHGNNGGLGYTSTPAGTHGSGTVNVVGTGVTYSNAGTPANPLDDTCNTTVCHSPSGGTWGQSNSIWGTPSSVGCSDCHYYELAPTNATNNASYWSPLSTTHGDHFVEGKACTQCHPNNSAETVGPRNHINGTTGANDGAKLLNVANGSIDEPAVVRTSMVYSNGLADGAGVNNTCTGGIALGCHATGVPDWDVAFAATACTNCHTDTSTATVNPTSGLHAVTPSISNQRHDNSIAGGCAACHTPGVGHQNGTLTGDGSLAVDRTAMGIGAGWSFGATDNAGTCANIGTSTCHDTGTGNSALRNDWAHKWTYSATVGTAGANSCAGCHGDWDNGWNGGVLHRTAGATQATHGDQGTNYDCYECHVIESAAYTFTFPGTDWGGTSHHGDGSIQVNANTNGTATVYNTTTNLCTGCHSTADGTHDFVDTGWNVSTALSSVNAITATCNGCHGGATPAQAPVQPWTYPDSLTADTYPDRAGSHSKHMAITGVVCTHCHPGNPPAGHGQPPTSQHVLANTAEVTRTDTDNNGVADVWLFSEAWNSGTTAVYFKNIAGVNDTDAYYNETTHKCSNMNCHGGVVTDIWYPDTTAPVWSPSYSITATAGAGFATVTWNPATDASTPVHYDVYASTTNTAVAVFTGPPVATDISGTSAIVARAAGAWYFGVRATDSAKVPNSTSGETISTVANVTAGAGGCGTGTATALYTNMAAGTFGIDGTQAPATLGATVAYDSIGGRRPMQVGTTGLTANSIRFGTWPAAGTFYRHSRFYLAQGGICVGPGVTAANITKFSTAAGDQYQLRLVDYDPAGASYNGTTIATSANYTSATVATAQAFTFAAFTTAYQIPAGHYLVLEVWVSAAATGNIIRVYGGGTTNTTGTYFTIPIYNLPTDVTAPVWTGGISNIAVTNPNSSGDLSVTWNVATDAGTPPVKYDLYRSSVSAADVWNNLVKNDLSATSVIDTGLTNGTTYWYGVRAHDSKATPNYTSNDAQTASAIPTGAGSGCTTCHGTAPTSGAHSRHANTDAVYTDCDKCHGSATVSISPLAGGGYTNVGPAGLHNNGSTSMYFLRIAGETNASYNDVAPPGDTCANVNCHSNTLTPSWNSGTLTCAGCHGYPPSTGTNHLLANREGSKNSTDAAFYTAHGNCDVCHGISGNATPPAVATLLGTPVSKAGGDTYDPALHHANGSVTMNGTASAGDGLSAEYVEATNGCNKSCHTALEKFTVVQANPVHLLRLGGGECTGCHKVGGSGSMVTIASPHSTTITGRTCEYCHTGHSAGTVTIPNYANVGINYTGNGETGIALGNSTGALGATEAEICWNCHAAKSGTATILDGTDPSEWGLNTDTNAAAANYNFGTLTGTASWFTGTWTSANFSYKTGKLIDKPTSTAAVVASGGSTHAANPLAGITLRGVDTVAQVRCSYCHDVHDTKAGSPSGKPYLRGTWKGNPYKEDGAPRSGITFASGIFGAVPRGSVTATGAGGYQIDQNNASPTAAWTLADSAGLCGLCHGSTAPGALTATSVNTLDQFAAASRWVGTNGHAAAVLGGGNASAFNLLTESTRRHPATGYSTVATGGDGAFDTAPWMGYKQLSTASQGLGLRGAAGDGFGLAPAMNQPYAHASFAWGTTIDNGAGAIQSDYHNFSCSKCHNPHASRLPALAITNCLDTKVNTWDDTQGLGAGVSAENTGVRVSNFTSAQNCHRRRDPAFGKTWTGAPAVNTDGWNNVTPW